MNEEKLNEQEKVEELQSLRDFIEINQKMIAVIGVFVAVGLFWKNIYKDEQSIPYISYLCFLITVPLFLEVRKGYESKKSSWNLKFFVDIFSGILLLTSIHLLTNYTNHLESLLYGVIFGLMFYGLNTLVELLGKYLKDKRYKQALKYERSLIEKETPIEERNILITRENSLIRRFGSIIDFSQLLSLILIIAICFKLTSLITDNIHLVLDVELQRKINVEVTVPDVEDNNNMNPQ